MSFYPSEKPKVRIKNWEIETWIPALTGNIYGHPNHEDGKMVYTSRLLNINFEERTAETLNTIYILE